MIGSEHIAIVPPPPVPKPLWLRAGYTGTLQRGGIEHPLDAQVRHADAQLEILDHNTLSLSDRHDLAARLWRAVGQIAFALILANRDVVMSELLRALVRDAQSRIPTEAFDACRKVVVDDMECAQTVQDGATPPIRVRRGNRATLARKGATPRRSTRRVAATA